MGLSFRRTCSLGTISLALLTEYDAFPCPHHCSFCTNFGNKTYQVVLFSATFPDHVRRFAEKFAPQANEIRLKQEELSLAAIKQFFLDCDGDHARYDVLVELYSLLTSAYTQPPSLHCWS